MPPPWPRWALPALLLLAATPIASCSDASETEGPRSRGPTPNATLPAPESAIPREPAPLAAALADTTADLRTAIDRWREADTNRGGPPRDVTLLALYQQRVYLLLTPRRRLADAVVARLPAGVRGEARDILAARRALRRLSPPSPRRTPFRTGRALPAGALARIYRRAERRFGVSRRVLAAVNFVETGFNKIRSNSTAGAQGPMQFIPSTWRAYGMGGDIRDPEDAIMGAANYLHASGAPGDYRRALYAYNPSSLYVDAVLRFARRIRRDARAFYAFYSWQIFVRTTEGSRRLTGPGL